MMPFFNRVGFALPERKGIADFLQEVTSPKDQAQYWCAHNATYIIRSLLAVTNEATARTSCLLS